MSKSVTQQALEFVKDLAAYREEYTSFKLSCLVDKAQAIVDQMCKHNSVKSDQFCKICGWHNVPHREGKRCQVCHGIGKNSEATSGDCWNCDGAGLFDPDACGHTDTDLQSGRCNACGVETR